MKLYYAPGACSLAPSIALREAGMKFEMVRVDFMRNKSLPDGRPFTSVNPKGYVPALELDDGRILTENAAVLRFIADMAPEAKLAPPPGTPERLELEQWLVYIATELHKGMGVLFSPKANPELKEWIKVRLAERFGVLEKELADKPWLMGDRFTVADAYALYCVRTWVKLTGVDLDRDFPALAAFRRRAEERPAVRAALSDEGFG